MGDEHISDENLERASRSIIGFARLLGALAACVTIIGAAVWFVVAPYIEPYFEKVAAIEAKVIQVEITLSQILNAEQVLPSLEFKGNGLVVDRGPFQAGGLVPIGFWLRRNEQCGSRVLVRFYDAATGRYPTDLTYELTGTPANASKAFQFFVVNVKLPDHMPSGRYMYQALVTPQGCTDGRVIVPPPSEFFEVVGGDQE